MMATPKNFGSSFLPAAHMEMRGKLVACDNFSYLQLMVMQWGEPLHEIAQGINVEVLEFVAGQFYFDC